MSFICLIVSIFRLSTPARDEFDTFLIKQRDQQGKALVAPAHTSTMQNRILKRGFG